MALYSLCRNASSAQLSSTKSVKLAILQDALLALMLSPFLEEVAGAWQTATGAIYRLGGDGLHEDALLRLFNDGAGPGLDLEVFAHLGGDDDLALGGEGDGDRGHWVYSQ